MLKKIEIANLNALVLAGGQGTRLRPVLGDKAKVLAQVGEKPFLSHLLSHLGAQGIQRVVLALGCFHQEVLDYLDSQSFEGLQVVPVVEDEPLGTAGAIRNALQALDSDPVLVLNGDTFAEIHLESLLAFHQEQGATVTLAAASRKNIRRYGSVETDEAGRVLHFIEKGHSESGHVSVGIYLISRQVIRLIPPNRRVSWERDTLPALVGHGLFACCGSFRFIDIGTPGSYQRAAEFLEKR
jgi:NDP-sugar pyrophosphorylase family protein